MTELIKENDKIDKNDRIDEKSDRIDKKKWQKLQNEQQLIGTAERHARGQKNYFYR